MLKKRREAYARAVAAGLTQVEAAVRAGYRSTSAAQTGYRLAHIPEVAARVQALRGGVPLVAEQELLTEMSRNAGLSGRFVRPVIDTEGHTRGLCIYLAVP